MNRGRWLLGVLVLAAQTGRAFTLEEALAAAQAGNPGLEASMHRVEQASALLTQAESTWYPQVSVSAGYTRTDNPPQAFFMNLNQRSATLEEDFNQPGDTENIRGTVALRMLLLDGGQRTLAARMAKLDRSAREALVAAARNELAYAVTEAWYRSLQARAFMTVQEETIRSLEENLRVAEARVEAGSAIRTDVLNLEVQLADARENLIRSGNRLRLAVASLNAAIGEPLATPDNLHPEDPEGVPAHPPASPDPGRVDDRPELAGALLQLEAAGLAVKQAARSRLPRVHAFGSLDWDSEALSDLEESYLAGVSAEWDLFTGFRQEAQTAEARAARNEAQAAYASLRNQLVLDLKRAGFAVEEAWERLGVADQSLASARESLRITRQRYEEGAADITELLTAQVGLTSTRTRLAAARYDYRIALANLDRALGHPGRLTDPLPQPEPPR